MRRMFGDDAKNLRGLDNIFRLPANNDLFSDHRELNGTVGKRFLDLSFEDLERLL